MLNFLDSLPSIAASSSTVLISGEPGTGRKHLAKKIHEMGPWSDRPFTSIDCRAMPASFAGGAKNETSTWLLEILSHYFKIPSGTCFLDEVDEASASFQQIILGMLQERTNDAQGPRIIASISSNLQELVREGKFRDDLYYRLNVMKLELPPLRLRKVKIASLVEEMINRFNQEHGKSIKGIDLEAMAKLTACDWPGNIGELESAIEHCFMVCRGSLINIKHLPEYIQSIENDNEPLPAAERIAYHIMASALKHHEGNFSAAAEELGMSETSFAQKAQKWFMEPV